MYSLVMHVQVRMTNIESISMDWIVRVSKENAARNLVLTSFKQRNSRAIKEYFKVFWEYRYGQVCGKGVRGALRVLVVGERFDDNIIVVSCFPWLCMYSG